MEWGRGINLKMAEWKGRKRREGCDYLAGSQNAKSFYNITFFDASEEILWAKLLPNEK